MGLDVRLPIGMLFAAIGIALCVYGAMSDPAIYEKSLGINVNLLWGGVLLAFGALMLLLGLKRDRGSGIGDLGSEIGDPGSGIGPSGIADPRSRIPNRETRRDG